MKTLCAILVMLFALSGYIYAEGTGQGVTINNTASVTAGNVASAVSSLTIGTNVKRIGGARYTFIPGDNFASPLGTTYLTFTIENCGNGNDMFALSVLSKTTNFGADWAADTAWTYNIVEAATTVVINQTTLTAPAGTFTFRLEVKPPVTADDADYMEWRIDVRSLSNTAATTYTNDQGGSSMGVDVFYGRSIAFGTNAAATRNARPGYLTHVSTNGSGLGTQTANPWIKVTISGPVLVVTKTITGVTTAGVASVAQPGAIITYSIKVTNQGAASATNIRLRDPVPANTAFVAQTAGTYFKNTATQGLWTNVNLPSHVADTVTYRVRIN